MARLTDRELDMIQQARDVPSWPSWEEVDAILLAARHARAKLMARWMRRGLAPLANAAATAQAMAGRAVLPLRRDLLRRRTVAELRQLDDRILADIGIAREQVEPVAADLAKAALLSSRPRTGLLDGISSWRRRRAAVRQLEALDDHLLDDIGLRRDDIREAVERAAVGALRAPASDKPSTDKPSKAGLPALRQGVPIRQVANLLGLVRRWLQRRATIRELEALDDRMLADIGLLRREIPAAIDQLTANGGRAARALIFEQANDWDSVVHVLRNWETNREPNGEIAQSDPEAAVAQSGAQDNFNRPLNGLAQVRARRRQAA